ncbi:MAG: glycosyltransferase [Candidatus Riflebacteria bacterium]|nr:glycosyltransferase [Candidatus Riflebacteria bacterium]
MTSRPEAIGGVTGSASLPEAAVWRSRGKHAPDGGAYRKNGLLAHLRRAGRGELSVWSGPDGASLSSPARFRAGVASLLDFLATVRARKVLFFYPDFPFLLPASLGKLPALGWLVWRVRRLLETRGLEAVVDVEDLPGPQLREFTGQRHPGSDLALATFERWLDRFANELWVPTASMAGHWARRTGRAHPRVRLVPTCSLQHAPAVPDRCDGAPRFFYAGELDPLADRGVSEMIRAFRKSVPGQMRLVLAGPGGGWVRELGHPSVEVLGALEEESCRARARECHWGLVPYPERGYFHEVFPAKLSFYTSCGLPVVTTEVSEAARAVRDAGVGSVVPMDGWREFFVRCREGSEAPPRVECPWLWERVLPSTSGPAGEFAGRREGR